MEQTPEGLEGKDRQGHAPNGAALSGRIDDYYHTSEVDDEQSAEANLSTSSAASVVERRGGNAAGLIRFIPSASVTESPSHQIHYSGRFLTLASVDGWEYVKRSSASGVVAILAVTDDGDLVLTEQHRPPVDARVIDLPAGLAGDVPGQETEDLRAAAERELVEETGFAADALEPVALMPMSPGLTSETVLLFRASGVRRVDDGGGDETECIDVHLVPLADVSHRLHAAVDDGRLIDPKVYAALWWLDH